MKADIDPDWQQVRRTLVSSRSFSKPKSTDNYQKKNSIFVPLDANLAQLDANSDITAGKQEILDSILVQHTPFDYTPCRHTNTKSLCGVIELAAE